MIRAGFDWDGTISTNVEEFKILARLFDRFVIVTLNESITIESAAKVLNVCSDKIADVVICPESRVGDYWHWKSDVARDHKVDIFFDDDKLVAETLRVNHIPCLAVAEL